MKEGGIETLLQVTTIALMGAFISNLVCFLLWSQSATSGLRRNMERTLESFNVLLGMVVSVFLGEGDFGECGPLAGNAVPLGKNRKYSYEKIKNAVEGHQSSFTSLKKSLEEARTEWGIRMAGERRAEASSRLPTDNEATGSSFFGFMGNGGSRKAYEDAVTSLNRLAQHLNGLRSGTSLQYELARSGALSRRGKNRTPQLDGGAEEDEDAALLRAAAAMFGDLVDELGPPLKALSVRPRR